MGLSRLDLGHGGLGPQGFRFRVLGVEGFRVCKFRGIFPVRSRETPPPPKGFVEPKCRSRGLPLGLGQVEFGRMARQVLSGGMLGANIGDCAGVLLALRSQCGISASFSALC